jgi:tetratricopeptide (TPR) repeat protein
VQAGERAIQQGAPHEGGNFLQRALELLPAADTATQWRILLAHEGVLQLLGEQAARRADIESLLQLAHTFGEDRRLAQAYWTKSKFFADSGDQRAVLLTIEQANSAAAHAGDVARQAESLALKAMALIRLGDVAAGQTAIEQALAAMEQVTSDFTRTQVLKFAWNYYYNAGDIAKSLHYGKLALEVAQQSADRSNETVIRSNLGLNYAMLGMYELGRICKLTSTGGWHQSLPCPSSSRPVFRSGWRSAETA